MKSLRMWAVPALSLIHICVQSVLGGRGGKCVLKDDFDWLLDKMLDADGIVFSTPIFEKLSLIHIFAYIPSVCLK